MRRIIAIAAVATLMGGRSQRISLPVARTAVARRPCADAPRTGPGQPRKLYELHPHPPRLGTVAPGPVQAAAPTDDEPPRNRRSTRVRVRHRAGKPRAPLRPLPRTRGPTRQAPPRAKIVAFASPERERARVGARTACSELVQRRTAPRGAIQPGGVKGPTSGRRNGREKLRGSLKPEVRWRAGAAPDDRATVRCQRAGCGSKAERRRRRTSVRSPDTGRQPRNWRLWAVGMLDLGCCSGSSCPPVFCSGGRGCVECCGSAWRCPRGTAGRRPCQPVDSERGKRPGGARRTRRLGSGAGAPSAVAAGAWRRTRSSRGSHAPPWRAGKPSTGRRGPVSTQHDWMGGGRR